MNRFVRGFGLIFVNYIVSYIPCWTIRKAFYSLAGMKIGAGSRILMGAKIQGINNIEIGTNSYINWNCHLDGRGGLKIGNNVNISNYSVIITAAHDMKSEEFEYRTGKVVIEDYCWLGTRAVVLDRTTLSKATVLSAGSVFKGVTEPDSVYIGVPATKARNRGLRGAYDLKWRPFFI